MKLELWKDSKQLWLKEELRKASRQRCDEKSIAWICREGPHWIKKAHEGGVSDKIVMSGEKRQTSKMPILV